MSFVCLSYDLVRFSSVVRTPLPLMMSASCNSLPIFLRLSPMPCSLDYVPSVSHSLSSSLSLPLSHSPPPPLISLDLVTTISPRSAFSPSSLPFPSLSPASPLLPSSPSVSPRTVSRPLEPGQTRSILSMEYVHQAARHAAQQAGATRSAPAASLLLHPPRGHCAQTRGARTGAVAAGGAGACAQEDSAASMAAILCAPCL